MDMRSKIQWVLDSDMSAYYIMKETGVSDSKISRLRNGKNTIDKMSFGMAEKLAELCDKENQ
ncbi:XRE family transcriptional regulator [Weissella ceti]|uniref:XRE family transcriptional regulator n=1 Tax=Weissella ceti TaxID=759620 RepID=A0ABT3E3L8_9LACO|nr:XRE family transcriptional regulator [Weissella ceti]MCW0953016.1 XRE family transcriptional regulator [Weissella ceti]QVK11562.1 XRE family transcriptional regulator [Weissella ceti]